MDRNYYEEVLEVMKETLSSQVMIDLQILAQIAMA